MVTNKPKAEIEINRRIGTSLVSHMDEELVKMIVNNPLTLDPLMSSICEI